MLETVESTQDEAAARFNGTPLLVVSAHQSRGRGRFNRTWVEPDRGLFASMAFQPAWPPEHWGLIPLVAGLAMREAIADSAGEQPGLRWPNDLMIGPAKVGGILVEATGVRAIVGCGVNLWWPEPIEGAGAVHDTDPGSAAAQELGGTWAHCFLRRMAAGPASWGRNEYEAACVTVGQPVAAESGEGTAVGVGADGSLLLDTGDGLVAVHAGEIRSATTLPTPPADGGAETEESS